MKKQISNILNRIKGFFFKSDIDLKKIQQINKRGCGVYFNPQHYNKNE